MSSNPFHDLIGLDVVHYSFELTRRIATISDKIHATEFNHFIKLFFYPIQNRDSTFFFKLRASASTMRKRNIEILKTTEWSTDLALLNSYSFENCNILTKTRFLKILFWSERMPDFWKLIDVRRIYVKIEDFSWKSCECVILLNEVFKWCFRWKLY